MTTIKTAISLPDALFEQVELVAQELQLSRSGFFALAVEDFLRRYENRKLLDAFNAAYADGLDAAENDALDQMNKVRQQLAAEEPW
jgi:metal-responsive CopG/Arc/MetJ family transcriptional regulator